jgi:hypothetical protein
MRKENEIRNERKKNSRGGKKIEKEKGERRIKEEALMI